MSKKINQFSTRAKYVSPSSKTVEVNVFESVLSGSYGEEGDAGKPGSLYNNTGEESF